jgi:uncharacterized protein YbjT (DUF2867 family)
MPPPLILVTGASGYIASRLIPRLVEKGYRVRAFARRPEWLATRAWAQRVEFVRGDVTDPVGLESALEGVHTAYYLIHSMAGGRGYMRIETDAARTFSSVAERTGVLHIIYLGGLADPNARNLAPHMRSRIETGNTLRQGKCTVTEFRAGVIVGPGSISFEMIRFLTECFPVLPGPSWLKNKVQPISARNVIDYLVAALDHPEARGGIYELGGPDVMLYAETMLRYAGLRGLRRRLFTLPGIPISLMARIVDWLTPVPASIAAPLIGGLQSDSIVRDDSVRHLFHELELIPYEQAVTDSLVELNPAQIERVWEGLGRDLVSTKHEGFYINFRRVKVDASPVTVYRVLMTMGGWNGWPFANWLWSLRGWFDGLIGGVGLLSRKSTLSRITRSSAALNEGDNLDYYRVESLEPDHLLRLFSELRSPGKGWMEWRVEALPGRGSTLIQTAFFAPRGLPGFLYWLLLDPLHSFVFRGLILAIKRQSEAPQ